MDHVGSPQQTISSHLRHRDLDILLILSEDDLGGWMFNARLGSALHREERGAAAVEFALVVVPFVTLLLGTIQFAWYFYGAQSASAAAREGAREVVIGKCWVTAATPDAFADYVKAESPMVTNATYTPNDLTAANIGDEVTFTVQADAGSINFLPLPGGGHVTRTFQARLEDKSPGDGTC